jgi:hypothetical protein
VAIEQSAAAMIGGRTGQPALTHGLRISPVPKTEHEIRAITSFAEELWHKHDAMRMMEVTNKEIHEQIKEDMVGIPRASVSLFCCSHSTFCTASESSCKCVEQVVHHLPR